MDYRRLLFRSQKAGGTLHLTIIFVKQKTAYDMRISDWSSDVCSSDLVVVGSGAAASVAALAAAKDGAKVLMLEKAPVYGGTSAKSGGAFWVPNNFRLKERGIEDPKASLLAYCAAYSYPHLFDSNSPTLGLGEDVYNLLEAFYDNASPDRKSVV